MKNLQTRILKIIGLLLLFFSVAEGYAQNERIARADSLFKAKQYTQSLEIYQSVFNEKKYSSAMLLRMAYINEGLGRVGATLYFLKLYHLATNDEQALKKAEELASKNKLAGYESNDAGRLLSWLNRNIHWIQSTLLLLFIGVAAIVFIQRSKQQNPWAAFVVMFIIAAGLFYSNNLFKSSSVIVSTHKAYLMAGPSSGSAVVGIIDEGSLLKSFDKQDVWIKVKWLDKDAYLKENAVLKVSL